VSSVVRAPGGKPGAHPGRRVALAVRVPLSALSSAGFMSRRTPGMDRM